MRKKNVIASLIAVITALIIGFLISFFSQMPSEAPSSSQSELSVHFLDVGQGDCEIILLPNNKTMVIDAGNNNDERLISSYLKDLDIETIDYLVGTHPHADHVGSLDYLINNFTVNEIYLPECSSSSQTYKDVLSAIDNANLKVNIAKSGTVICSDGSLSISVVAPVEKYEDLNNQSLVIRLVYKKASFLFTGDAEEESENDITSDISADVLKVGHHGSRTSTSNSFLTRVDPMYAVISCGKNNQYGHPHAETLERLENDDVTIYRTDTMGTLICKTNGNGVTDYRWESVK